MGTDDVSWERQTRATLRVSELQNKVLDQPIRQMAMFD
jgi:hypothetical protein